MKTFICVTAERTVMNRLEGGCQVPIGAYCRFEGDELVLDAMVGSVDGTTILRVHERGSAIDPVELGERAVEALRKDGADEVLRAVREAEGSAELL
jgi:hydroxymethylbilane synthase